MVEGSACMMQQKTTHATSRVGDVFANLQANLRTNDGTEDARNGLARSLMRHTITILCIFLRNQTQCTACRRTNAHFVVGQSSNRRAIFQSSLNYRGRVEHLSCCEVPSNLKTNLSEELSGLVVNYARIAHLNV